MRIVVGLIVLMMIASPVFAALTAQEETTLRQFIANKDKIIDVVQHHQTLIDVADGITNETVPLELTILRNERHAIIAERDLAIEAVKAQAISDVNDLMSTYEVLIDAQEALISAKEAELVTP